MLSPGESDQIVEALRTGFAAAYDTTPDVIGRAPGRVNLMGEHTDYNDGLCLPIALPHSCYAAARRRDDGRVRVASRQKRETWEGFLGSISPGSVSGWPAYVVGVLWTLGQAGYDVPGVDLLIDSRVPVGGGLSSSAAVEVSVAVAIAALLGLPDTVATRETLVAACRRAETEVVGAPTGGLDQTASLFGDVGAAVRIDFADGSRHRVELPLTEAGVTLLVTDTRVAHALVGGGYGDRRLECRAAAEALGLATLREATADGADSLTDPVLRRRARHVLTENARVDRLVTAVARGAWPEAGRLLVESHVSLRDDFEVSCPELDVVVTASVAAGALGARMTGGGFGGSAVALVRTDDLTGVVRAVDEAFQQAGFDPPAHLLAPPSAAADLMATD